MLERCSVSRLFTLATVLFDDFFGTEPISPILCSAEAVFLFGSFSQLTLRSQK